MRAISLWQPWATAVALGVKRVDTRHWSTDYRGPLAIQAAKRIDKDFARTEVTLGRLPSRIPCGALVAVCDLVDVRRSDEVAMEVSAIERLYGNYEPGRFAWLLDNIRALPEPIPYTGRQSFFTIPDDSLPPEFRQATLL